MTTKTIAKMIAEFPEEPNLTPTDGPIGDEHDRIHIARWQYRRLLAKVALLRAALERLYDRVEEYDMHLHESDDACKVLEVTK